MFETELVHIDQLPGFLAAVTNNPPEPCSEFGIVICPTPHLLQDVTKHGVLVTLRHTGCAE